jgi:hypothetical protein
VGARQRRENLGFALKPREPVVIGSDRRRQDLDRDLPLQLRVGRAIDLAHAPAPMGPTIS